MFPVLAKTQDDKKRFNDILEKSFNTNMFVMLPICVGLFCVSESFINLLLGAKWLPASPYIQIFCVVVLFNSIEAIFSNGPMALGKSTASMLLGILECLISIGLLAAAIPFGVMAIGYSMIVASVLNCIIYFVYLKVLTGFNAVKAVLNSIDSITASLLMGVAVYSLNNLQMPYYVVLILQIIIGVIIYFVLNKLFVNKAMSYSFGIIKNMLARKKEK